MAIVKKILILSIFLNINISSFAQKIKTERHWGPTAGINAFNKISPEVGYCFLNIFYYGINGHSLPLFLDASLEVPIQKKFIIGPKATIKTLFCVKRSKGQYDIEIINISLGASFIAYNDFKTIDPVFRPSIGIAGFCDFWEISYGYNIKNENKNISPFNSHVIQLLVKWPFYPY